MAREKKKEWIDEVRALSAELHRTALTDQTNASMEERLNAALQNLEIHQEELRAQNESLIQEREISESMFKKYSVLFDNAPVGYFIIDKNSAILEANVIGAEMLGQSLDHLEGKPLFLYLDSPSRKVLESHFRAVYSGKMASDEVSFLGPDGKPFPVVIKSSPLSGQVGKNVRSLTAIFDITQVKNAELALASRTAALIRSNADLQQFAYVASHDLKEPLRTVSSFLQLLDRQYGETLDKEAHEYIDFAIDGAKRMDALIKGLLSFSRVDSHGDAYSEVDCGGVLQDVQDNLKSLIEESNATVIVEALPIILADSSQVMQVFQNLIGNALKYCSPDRAPEISVKGDVSGGVATFSVQDNGIGMEEQFYDRIFLIFQRLHGREEYDGTGIGLAVCKRIVDHHGGGIWVESKPGIGSTFFFTLPVSGGEQI